MLLLCNVGSCCCSFAVLCVLLFFNVVNMCVCLFCWVLFVACC